jgi:hypothetical protein
MKIVDKTPYRTESGEIEIMGRMQGMLKFGLSWYDRVKAQDAVIAIFNKQLGNQYTILQNIVLPGTEIDLPLILIGPPGIYLINVTHERGVYRARDDEWGTISGEQFVPARINHVKRTVTMGRVLQVYLDRQGYKGMLMVDPILMAADPGMHIDSTRPAVRIVMSDALDRFGISLAQARVLFSPEAVSEIADVILSGRSRTEKQAAGAKPSSFQPAQDTSGGAFTPEAFAPSASEQASGGSLDFAFDETAAEEQSPEAAAEVPQEPDQEEGAQARRAAPKRGGAISRSQWVFLIALVLCWLCSIAIFVIYIMFSLGYITF